MLPTTRRHSKCPLPAFRAPLCHGFLGARRRFGERRGPSVRRVSATLQIVQPSRDCASKLPGAVAPRRHERRLNAELGSPAGSDADRNTMHVQSVEASAEVEICSIPLPEASTDFIAMQNKPRLSTLVALLPKRGAAGLSFVATRTVHGQRAGLPLTYHRSAGPFVHRTERRGRLVA